MGIHAGSGQSYGNGKGTENFFMKKKIADVSKNHFEKR